ncbi:MAG: hypothetical protein Q7U63_00860 [Polaromonas sp.]|nr:hypothetical protein [Polaromonas sp.]MDO9112326.1 hypothetical protein [Polaromonas sp.]MDP1888145.1 hypothetical protein [Polaromonas sp.]
MGYLGVLATAAGGLLLFGFGVSGIWLGWLWPVHTAVAPVF